jgi:hypothetical protein
VEVSQSETSEEESSEKQPVSYSKVPLPSARRSLTILTVVSSRSARVIKVIKTVKVSPTTHRVSLQFCPVQGRLGIPLTRDPCALRDAFGTEEPTGTPGMASMPHQTKPSAGNVTSTGPIDAPQMFRTVGPTAEHS